MSKPTDLTGTARAPVSAAAPERATPLELFFDLVYVFAFTQVTHLMADGENFTSVLAGLAVLGVLWWSWASYAWLANQQIADRGAVRVGLLGAIAIVLVLSIAIPEAYPEENGSLFAALLFSIGFMVLSVVYTVVTLGLAGADWALRRQVLRTMGVTILPVAAALIVGAVLGGTAQLVLWLTAVAIEGATVYLTSRGGQWRLPSAAHYAERHGLVVILALGESIISIGLAASHSPLTPVVVGASLLAVCLSLGLWRVYFGEVSPTAERQINALSGQRRAAVATVGTYLHLGIVAGILLASLGMGGAIERIGSGEPIALFSWAALAGGVVLFLASTASYARAVRPRLTPVSRRPSRGATVSRT